MTRTGIDPGVCGPRTVVKVRSLGDKCALSIESDCEAVRRLAEELTEADALREISHRGETPRTHEVAAQNLPHAGCPVPAAIIKAIEVEAGLALPANTTITLAKIPG